VWQAQSFTTFSEDALQFSWQAQRFGRVQRHFAWEGHTLEMGHKVTNIFILSFCVVVVSFFLFFCHFSFASRFAFSLFFVVSALFVMLLSFFQF